MKNIILIKFTAITFFLLMLSMFSCKKENTDLNNLNDTFFLRHRNADMPVNIYGNGSEKVFLIILHGGPGDQGLGYRTTPFFEEIEKNNAVVYFDQRGSGSSQGNYSKKDLSVDIMAEDVLALAKLIKAKYGNDSKLFLMGHSWGGTLGTATLLKNQNPFLGWIEVCGGHNMFGGYELYKQLLPQTANEQIALGNSVDFWQNIIDEVKNIGPDYSTENHLALNTLANSTGSILAQDGIINKSQVELADKTPISNGLLNIWNMRKTGKILDFQEGLNLIDFTNRLNEITIPSLVLWGKHDLTVPLALGIEAYDNLGSSEKDIFIFEKSAHGPMSSEPDLFADKVIGFINKHK